MPKRRRYRTPLVVKSAELALATPQVVAHRVARMALAGARPALRDRREFERMASEKVAAFSESWNAMAWEVTRANMALATSFVRMFWLPWLYGPRSFSPRARRVALRVLDKGIDPVHRRAVANARRLAHTKLR